ncbi:STAS domain-containing protein [Streptomyces sp. NPDC058476]|uniref:STAS domain-containing protein n=1 Tax=Streptomyces sp. NPDC058476 TaxID=3346519 RepID=UPI00365B5204
MNPLLRIDTADTRGQAAALTMAGPLDLATAPVLQHTLDEALNHHPTVILDLTGVTFCDSSGLNTLIRLRRRAHNVGGELLLAAPPRQMMRLLTITGADGVFPIHGSLAEAWQAAPGTPP